MFCIILYYDKCDSFHSFFVGLESD